MRPPALQTAGSILFRISDEGWWGRQDSNLRRHSQRIYSPPPLPLGTLPRSRRTVLISKDKSGSPAGRVVSVLCGSYPCQVNRTSRSIRPLERRDRRQRKKKAAGG